VKQSPLSEATRAIARESKAGGVRHDRLRVEPFFDSLTSNVTYLVYDDDTRVGVVIDTLTDFDLRAARTSNESSTRVARVVDRLDIDLQYALETHVHADHLTALPFFADYFGARSVIGAGVGAVQTRFRDFFGLGADFPVDGSQFDVLVTGGDILSAGPLRIEILDTPGHTPACVTYRIGDSLFVGDTLFTPDYGVARCDFPGGSAEALFESIQRLYALPEETAVLTAHDYRPGGRPPLPRSSIGEHRRANVQLRASTSRSEFVAFRHERDATLALPALMLAAVQVNIRAGRLPACEANGVAYLKIPLNRL
jgi:glyoxylase-like metal-dependent hydrolase (beta-lactamase superfamily II)